MCITDDSERTHDSAHERVKVCAEGPYAEEKRKTWLERGSTRTAARASYESSPDFTVAIPGDTVSPYIRTKSGVCVRLMAWIFGEA